MIRSDWKTFSEEGCVTGYGAYDESYDYDPFGRLIRRTHIACPEGGCGSCSTPPCGGYFCGDICNSGDVESQEMGDCFGTTPQATLINRMDFYGYDGLSNTVLSELGGYIRVLSDCEPCEMNRSHATYTPALFGPAIRHDRNGTTANLTDDVAIEPLMDGSLNNVAAVRSASAVGFQQTDAFGNMLATTDGWPLSLAIPPHPRLRGSFRSKGWIGRFWWTWPTLQD